MKTLFTYDHYVKYEELKQMLETFAEKYPDLCSFAVNTVTKEGRNQYVVTITNTKTGKAEDKPALYIDGNIHAGEVTSSMAALCTMDYLVSNYGSDPGITKLLDEKAFYIIPRVTPDGAEKYLTTPYTLRSLPISYKTKEGGIIPEDLDEDGVIRSMRIPSSYGAWKEVDGQMVLRGPSDTEGTFYEVYPEGFLEEYEGDENLHTRKPDWGIDLNRNFPLGWFPDARQPGAGDYPLSQTETKAIVDFVLTHPNIGGAAIGHTSGGLFLYPPGTRPSETASKSDITAFKAIAQMGQEELGYLPLNIFDSFMRDQKHWDSGALDDWFYQSQGIPAYTVEFWDIATKAGMPYSWGPRESDPVIAIQRFQAMMKWVKENAPEYYMDWTPYDHPVFGKVEIGGFDVKHTVQNPPEKFLAHECIQYAKFNVRYAQALPQLVIESVSANKKGEGLYEITALVGNIGYLPTYLTEEAQDLKVDTPVKVGITGGTLLSGKSVEEIPFLSGYSRTAVGMHYGNLTTFASAPAKKKVTWLVSAQPGDKVTVSVSQAKAGCAEISIFLK